jgi:hypothetical protein
MNKCIINRLKKLQYEHGEIDPCLCIKANRKSKSHIVIYMNDTILATNNHVEKTNLEKGLSESYNIEKLGKIFNSTKRN